MKFYMHSALLFIIGTAIIGFTLGLPPQSEVHLKHSEGSDGKWISRTEWKSQWVREWIPKQIYVSIWKRVWTPLIVREWIPSLKLPVGWHPH